MFELVHKSCVLCESGLDDLVHRRTLWRGFCHSLAPRCWSFCQPVGWHKAVALETKNLSRSLSSADPCGRLLVSSQSLELGFSFCAASCWVAGLAAVEASAIFDIHLRFGAFLRRVPFREAVWTHGVFFAQSLSLSLGSPCASAFLMLFVEESAPYKGANFFVVRSAAFFKGGQLCAEGRLAVV